MQTVLAAQSLLLRSFEAFRPNLRGSMLVPFWERNTIRPAVIDDDPYRVFASSYETIYCADMIQQSQPQSHSVLDPPIAPLRSNIFIEHCSRNDQTGGPSGLALREKWMPQSSYQHVTLGRGLDLLLQGTLERPKFLQVGIMETGLDISFSQKEEVRFQPEGTGHTLSYAFESRNLLKALAAFGSIYRDMPSQLGPYVTIALALSSHLYLADPILFAHGFAIVSPEHHYHLRFPSLSRHPSAMAIDLCDNRGRPVPITVESFPPGPDQWCLYNRYPGLGTFAVRLYWMEHGLRLEMQRQPDMQSRGVRELENFFASAFNLVNHDQRSLVHLAPAQLDAVLTDQLANDLVRSGSNFNSEPAN